MQKSSCLTPLLISLATLALLIQHMYIKKTSSYRKMKQNRFRILKDLQAEYKTRLGEMPIHKYEETSRFLDIGPAVFNVTQSGTTENTILSQTKRILVWTKFFRQEGLLPGMSPILCEGEGWTCEATTDKSKLLSSHAVIMHAFNLRFEALPTKRLSNQRWIFFNQEPRHMLGLSMEKYNDVFNWTMSYRLDSDVPFPYIRFGRKEKGMSAGEHRDLLVGIMKRKTRLAAIIMSNCNRIQNGRLQFVREIRQHLPVDFYGACGDLSCPKGTVGCGKLMSSYKFYLSFENINCRDYMTEKVAWPLIYWEAVPIVLGAPEEDYARVLPPESYINAQGFASAARLAEYIRLLDENDELYIGYHSWRRTYMPLPIRYCELCKALHDPTRPAQSYRDFVGWYDEDVC